MTDNRELLMTGQVAVWVGLILWLPWTAPDWLQLHQESHELFCYCWRKRQCGDHLCLGQKWVFLPVVFLTFLCPIWGLWCFLCCHLREKRWRRWWRWDSGGDGGSASHCWRGGIRTGRRREGGREVGEPLRWVELRRTSHRWSVVYNRCGGRMVAWLPLVELWHHQPAGEGGAHYHDISMSGSMWWTFKEMHRRQIQWWLALLVSEGRVNRSAHSCVQPFWTALCSGVKFDTCQTWWAEQQHLRARRAQENPMKQMKSQRITNRKSTFQDFQLK